VSLLATAAGEKPGLATTPAGGGRRLFPALCLAAAVAGCGGPPAEEPEPVAPTPAGPPWLVDVTAEYGLDFRHETGGVGELHLPEIMGSGAALLDAEGDGDLDVYLIDGAFDLGRSPDPGGSRNRLYLQRDGRLVDATEGSGLGDPGYGMGVAVGDLDNDGRDDVYVSNYGPDRLFRNLGEGRFADVTAAAGIAVDGWSTSAIFVDFDRDGLLDVYVARYVAYDPRVKCYDTAGRHEYCGPSAFPGVSDVLLRNQGGFTFRDVSAAAGIAAVSDAGLGVVSDDFNDDGWPDVYVANDADPNQLWINLGDGTFRDEGLLMGASVNAQGATEAGMGVVAADFDGDALPDLFMTHLVNESNTLYRNLGSGLGFEDATVSSGLASGSAPFTGFGNVAFDAELDGDLDLALVNGRVLRGPRLPSELAPPWDDYAEPNLLYRNLGGGRFERADEQAGEFYRRTEISRGLAIGDLDGDGDGDLLLSNGQGPARIYRNDAPRRGRGLRLEAWDPRLGRLAEGAVVVAELGDRRLRRVQGRGSSYLSSSEPTMLFGLGEAARTDRFVVRWPDGLREVFAGVEAPAGSGTVGRLRLVRGAGRPE
jgi:hypothetical protein